MFTKQNLFKHREVILLAHNMERNNTYANALIAENKRLKVENESMRNELCYKCGKYKYAHSGACDGCRWKKEDTANDK